MQENFVSRKAWLFFTVLAALLILGGTFALPTGIDPTEFEGSTGIAWSEFSTSQPAAANYIMRLVRLLGAATISISLFVVALGLQAFRRKELWAYYTMWILPISFAGYTAVFYTHGAIGLAAFYGAAALICGLVLLLSRPSTN